MRKPVAILALALLGTASAALEQPSGVVAILRDGDPDEPGGSAVIIASDGTALSLAEAVPADAATVKIALPGGLRRSATVVKRDAASTAVLLRIADLPPTAVPLAIADSRRLRECDPVWSVGNAAGAIARDGEAALSQGVVSGLYDIPPGTPALRGRGGRELSSYRGAAIETDAAINDGNEGGALLDAAGHLVGLTSRGLARERRLPVAVPIARILDALDLQPAQTAPAGGGESWRAAAQRAAASIALVYMARLHGPGNPPGMPRPPRMVNEVPEADRERLQGWWDLYFHQQQIFYTDQPVCAVAVGPDLLLTAFSNLHGDADHGLALLADGQVPCRVVAHDLPLDLALLRTERPHGLPPAAFANAPPALGAAVAVVGRHRSDAGWTATRGTISATDRRRSQSTLAFLQTDARANYGSLGGPLIDATGAVVGLVVMLGPAPDRQWLINSGVALAVDCRRIGAALPGLRGGTDVEAPPVLGLGVVLNRRNDDLIVRQVTPGTGAAAAGIQPGDILLRVEGVRATSPDAVSRVLLRHSPGDQIQVELRRGTEERAVAVEVKEFTP